jgi:very-short-patch-repair endonuclease
VDWSSRPRQTSTRRAQSLRRRTNRTEQRLWAALRKHGLNVRRQAPIGPYVADFACHSARLVIEVDGPMHDLFDVNVRDAVRTEWLRTQGYAVIRFSAAEAFNDPEAVAEKIRLEIEQRTTRRTPARRTDGVAGKDAALPLDGGGLGGGVAPETKEEARFGPESDPSGGAAQPPPSPTLPPSRGKGRALSLAALRS